jgi:predicted exporter
MSDRSIRLLTIAVLVALAVYCVRNLQLTGSITHFIPDHVDVQLVQLSLDLVDSPLSRRMVLAIEGGPERERIAGELASRVRSHPEVAWVEEELDEDDLRAIHDLYFDRLVYFASEHPEVEIPLLLSPPSLDAKAARLRGRLAGPEAMLVSRLATRDPLDLFGTILERARTFRASQPNVEADGRGWTILQIGLRSSPFESARQVGLLELIDREFAGLTASEAGGFVLERSGINLFSVAAERSIRGDIDRISIVSISVVCALFLLVFRSLGHLLIAIVTPLIGFLVALSIEIASTDSVHGITLAFGFVLIGVAIDYPIHLMNHHALASDDRAPRASLAAIRKSLILSGLTTTLAFLSLSISSFPGLGDMGMFAAIGVSVSLVLTLFALPAFLRNPTTSTSIQRALASSLVRLTSWSGLRPRILHASLLGFVLIAAIGIPRLSWVDDPAEFMEMDPALLAEATRVQRRIGEFDGGRFVVGVAPDREAALVLNERIADRLQPILESGDLAGIGTLRSFLFSRSLQQRNLAALQAESDLASRIDTAFGRVGFKRDVFAPFTDSVASPPVGPLLPEDLEDSPLRRVLASMVELDDGIGVVTLLRGVQSGKAIQDALTGLDGAYYVDQQEIMTGVYQGIRHSTVTMLFVGAGLVLMVLLLRYRSVLRGLLAFLPAGLGAAATLGLFGLLGIEVNVVSSISLLVVLGMGVDYGVFAVDTADHDERLGATLSSLLVSCLTSVFVFGVLALSSQPILHSIGLTTGLGVLISLVLTIPVLGLARRP